MTDTLSARVEEIPQRFRMARARMRQGSRKQTLDQFVDQLNHALKTMGATTVSREIVRKIERGIRKPNTTEILAYSAITGQSEAWLLAEDMHVMGPLREWTDPFFNDALVLSDVA